MADKETLSIEKIIHTSIEILNADGLDKLSMRTLASKLNIKAASLYWHFKNKDELLLYISEYITEQCDYSDISGTIREKLTTSMIRYRSALKKIRDGVKIMELTPPVTPRRIEIINRIVDSISSLGVPDSKLFISANILNNYVLAFVADEFRMNSMNLIDNELSKSLTNINIDEEFAKGLDIILDGIEKQKTI